MARVITFGEIMLRLAPNGYYRFFQNDQMQATFGGGEANVAVSLANYGMDAAFVTKLPSHAIGQAAVSSLRGLGVDLIDLKLEFGRLSDGSIVLADEITPDTCRLWDAETGEKLDRDRFRRDPGGAKDISEAILHRMTGGNFM